MILLATITGAIVIANVSLTARLSNKTGNLYTLLINYIFGLLGAIVLIAFFRPNLAISLSNIPIWAYFGGLVGILIILICNYVLKNIQTFELTFLAFAGQMIAGILIDSFQGTIPELKQLIGILIVIIGLSIYSGSFNRPTKFTVKKYL